MKTIEQQMIDCEAHIHVLPACTPQERIVIAKIIDIVTATSPDIKLSRLFFLLDQVKEFILGIKRLKG